MFVICLGSHPSSQECICNLLESGIFLHKGNGGIINNQPTELSCFVPPLTEPPGFSCAGDPPEVTLSYSGAMTADITIL